ncbi:MAG TPA: hypothetical protein VMX16_15520 [Terriglobia bacterium]|nr:hypothetical protein [Terriglobia bacterium]
MTDSEMYSLKEQAFLNRQRALDELAAQTFKIDIIADRFENLVKGLRKHPELVTGTPQIGNPDYREELRLLDRQTVTTACDDIRQLKEKARIAEKRLATLDHGSRQSLIE